MLDSQFIQEQKMKMTGKETTQKNIPMTVRTKDTQDPRQSRPQNQLEKYPVTQIGVTQKM